MGSDTVENTNLLRLQKLSSGLKFSNMCELMERQRPNYSQQKKTNKKNVVEQGKVTSFSDLSWQLYTMGRCQKP